MRIAGLQNLSLVDFPDHLAIAVFLQGCNFTCGYCHNSELIIKRGPSEISQEEGLSLLSLLENRIEGVMITGGEPTVHDNLEELLIGRFVKGAKKYCLQQF